MSEGKVMGGESPGGTAGGAPIVGIEGIASALGRMARAAPRQPFVVGVVGSVAVGKSTMAYELAGLLSSDGHELRADVVGTDSFLLSNEALEPLGGAMVKGYPQSYDWDALDRFLSEAVAGAPVLSVPIYSHESFDVVAGAQRMMATPEILIVEGLNLLQAPPTSPVEVAAHLDCSIYLHAPAEVIEEWFVARFLHAVRAEHAAPDGFYAVFANMDDAEIDSIARWTWHEINAPNLHDHIEPTMARADVVVHKAADHSIERVEYRGS